METSTVEGDDAFRDVFAFVDALPAPEWSAGEPDPRAHGQSPPAAASTLSGIDDAHAAAHAAEAGVVSDFLAEILLPLEGADDEGDDLSSALRASEAMYDWNPLGFDSVALNDAALVPLRDREIASSLQPQRDAAPPSASATKRKKRQWNPNKARDERRDEIVYLRNTVQTLSAKLKALQAETAMGRGSAPHLLLNTVSASGQERSYPSDDDLGLTKGGVCATLELSSEQKLTPVPRNVWRDVALRQRHARTKAERENIRLKLVLEDQLKLAKRWEKMLLRKSVLEEFEKSILGNFSRRVNGRTDAEIFDELLAGLDEVYAMVDTVLRETGLAHQEGKYSDARVLNNHKNGNISLRICSSSVLPFDMNSTGTAAWTHFVFRKNNIPHRFYKLNFAKSVDTTEDTAVENYNLQIDVKDTTAHLGVKRAFRRYFEEDRIVIVFRTHFNPVELAEELLAGVSFRVTGYIIVKRLKTIPDENYSLLQLCYTYTPIMGLDHPKVGDMTDFMMRAAESYFTTSHELIENILLTQATNKLEGWCFDD
uniref:M96 mating-specific protein family n=1 Tax=Globisporangium ultimum (strain ATCC 200006 / CBS 805.95 / DAOM BR144) TaxID=431595 RepID=K3W8V5_GLOUD